MIGTMKETTILALLVAALATTPPVRADEGSLSVSPAVVTLAGLPGQSTTQTLTFTNGTSRPFSFEMIAQDALVRDGRRTYVEAGSLPGSIAATAVFSAKMFTVPPQQNVRVDVTVTIPAHPAVRAIAVLCHGITKLGNGPVKMTGSVGTLLTFALAGDVIAAVATPLSVSPQTASSNLRATQQVSNSGTAPVVATGMLAILDTKGARAGRQAIPGWRMLPGERTDVRVEYAGELRPGHYRALVTYDLTDKTLTSAAEFSVQ
jgi:hypothetical protein